MSRLLCAHCGDIVGVYEPSRLLLSDGTEHCGSPLTLGELPQTPGAIIVHEHCYETLQPSGRWPLWRRDMP